MGATSTLSLPARSRSRLFFLPREHGAWGMLLVPLVTGAAAGNPRGERIVWVLLLAVAALGLFCLRTPMEAWLKISALRPQNDRERRMVGYSIYIYASLSCMALIFLMQWAHAYGLLLLGAAAALAFILQTVLKQLGRQTRMNAQMIGAIALSSTAAGAYYLATGHLGQAAMIIWLANWLFAANQIHFVQLRIHSARTTDGEQKLRQGRGFLLHQACCLLLLVTLWRAGWLPGIILAAFAPLWVRGFVWFFATPRPLHVRRLGVSELGYAIAFGIVFIAGFHHFIG